MPDGNDKIQPSPTAVPPPWDDLRQELARDVDRVSDRLRSLSQARLAASAAPHPSRAASAAPHPSRAASAAPHPSRAASARETAQTLADAATGIEARHDRVPPTWRTLPELGDFAAGDQLAVTGHDLVAAAGPAAPDDDVWARHGRRSAHQVLAEAAAALAALRRLL